MNPVFFINPIDMSDGSGRLYSIDTQTGERIASTQEELAARHLRDALNEAVRAWAAVNPSDRVAA